MGKIRVFNILSNIPWETAQRFLSAWVTEATSQINGNLSLNDNIRGFSTVIGFTNSSNIRGITHSLGFVPNGYLVTYQTAAASIYAPQGATVSWTSNLIYLQASAGVTASLFII